MIDVKEKERYRYGFYRLLEGIACAKHEAGFGLYDFQEKARLESQAGVEERGLLVHFGAAKDALGLNIARGMLRDEARELARLYTELAEKAEEIAT